MAKKGTVNRRQFLKWTAGSAAALSLGAMRPRKSFGQTGKDLTIAISLDPGHFDPRPDNGLPGFSLMRHIYEPAMWHDEKLTLVPWLVETYEVVNPLTIKMKFRKGVKFHNGRPFTAEAFKVTIEDIKAPGSKSVWAAYCTPIKEIEIVDDLNVVLRFEEPSRPQLRNLKLEGLFEPKAFKELGNKIATNPIGTGPYKLREYVPGQYALIEAFEDYWGPRPKSKTMKWRFIPENGTRLAALEAEEVMMINNVPPDQVEKVKNNPKLEIRSSVTARSIYVGIRCDREPFTDVRVRQAMNYAVNKDAIVKSILRGYGKVATAPMAPPVYAFNPNLKPYPYDLKKAQELIAQAGVKGVKINYGCPNGRYLMDKQIGEAVAGFLQKVGFEINFESTEWATYITEVYKGDKMKYDLHFLAWGCINLEPDFALTNKFHSKWTPPTTAYKNPEVDKLINEGRTKFGDEEVRKVYFKAQELVWNDCPWIFLHYQPEITGVNRQLKGFTPFADEYLRFWNAYVG